MRALAAFVLFWQLLCPSMLCAAELDLVTPNSTATPVNQLLASGNACGPASLLNSFRFGADRWQEVAKAIPGSTDKSRLVYVIRRFSVKESSHFPGKKRWTHTGGVNLADLTDMANEMKGNRWLPRLSHEVLLAEKREKHYRILRRGHGRLKKSLDKGFPPIIGLQRYALSQGQWKLVKGHFVVVTAMPRRLSWSSEEYEIAYLDPWGGKNLRGIIRVADSPVRGLMAQQGQPTLIAEVPQTAVGMENVKKGEKTVVLMTSVLGAL